MSPHILQSGNVPPSLHDDVHRLEQETQQPTRTTQRCAVMYSYLDARMQ